MQGVQSKEPRRGVRFPEKLRTARPPATPPLLYTDPASARSGVVREPPSLDRRLANCIRPARASTRISSRALGLSCGPFFPSAARRGQMSMKASGVIAQTLFCRHGIAWPNFLSGRRSESISTPILFSTARHTSG